MRKRSKAREVALQALYRWEQQGEEFGRCLEEFLAEWARESDTRDFARELVSGCRGRLHDIDRAIASAARHWTLKRMATVDRNVLRLAVYELLFREDIPPRVSINEAVELAKRFSTAESGAFVNGILDRVMSGLPDERRDDKRTLLT